MKSFTQNLVVFKNSLIKLCNTISEKFFREVNMAEIKGEINQEVINTLIDLTKAIAGEKVVDNIMRSIMEKNKENVIGKDIVFTFADEIQNLFVRKGGYAIIRQLGRELAKSLMEKETTPKLTSQLKLNTQIKRWNVYMRKTGMSFKQIYKLTKDFF
jgi:iron uptake system EfeUOB component EfeO/EfeM